MIWGRHQEPEALEASGATSIGRVRPVNSDSWHASTLERFPFVDRSGLSYFGERGLFGKSEAKLLIVADGIGNEPGRMASSVAVQSLAESVQEGLAWMPGMVLGSGEHVLEILEAAFHESQTQLQLAAQSRADLQNMGTTATLACIVWPRLFITHVGDSRCYLLRDRRLEQLTTDHTFAQRLMEAGVLDAERASRSQWRNVLWNVLGGGSNEIHPETTQCVLQPGDILLLCSDGLSNDLSPDEIASLLDARSSADAMCRRLIRAANRAGGRDNITAVVVKCAGS